MVQTNKQQFLTACLSNAQREALIRKTRTREEKSSIRAHIHEIEEASTRKMNETQLQAMSASVSSKVALIQGPPGTGKTQVCANLQRLFGKLGPCLVSTQSNVAADMLARRFAENANGLRMCRIGNNEKVAADLQQFTADHVMKQQGVGKK